MKRSFSILGMLAISVLLLLIYFNQPAFAKSAQQVYPFLPGFPRSDFNSISNSGPAIVDLNHDGHLDIVIGDDDGCVWAWDAQGKVLPTFPWTTSGACSYTPRIDGPVAVGDVDGDGIMEVVAGTRGASNLIGQRGKVFVWKANGTLVPGWPQEITWNSNATPGNVAEVYTVALNNITGDSKLEVLAGTSNDSSLDGDTAPNLYAWSANGTIIAGYPTDFRAAGIWGNIATADLTGDGLAEVITGRDQVYLHAYQANGQELTNWAVRTYVDPTKTDYNTDLYMEFTSNAPVIGDLDNDGVPEIIVAGKIRDPLRNHIATNMGLIVVEPNGQRRTGWSIVKLAGAPLYDSMMPKQAPALADLDGDGKLEIVVPFADGTMRAYRENGNLLWTYDYAQGRHLFASEPVIGDVTGDGRLDILFGTYSPDGSANAYASVIGLNSTGALLPNFPLALSYERNQPIQGIRAGMALTDLDGNCSIDLVAGSIGGTLYVWSLPGRYRPEHVPWPMSRHDTLRTGSYKGASPSRSPSLQAPFGPSSFRVFLPLISGVSSSPCP